jgi:hypothetical protein
MVNIEWSCREDGLSSDCKINKTPFELSFMSNIYMLFQLHGSQREWLENVKELQNTYTYIYKEDHTVVEKMQDTS